LAVPQPSPPGLAILLWCWQCRLGLLEQNMELLNLLVLRSQLFLLNLHLVAEDSYRVVHAANNLLSKPMITLHLII
jgi:hypothetical protein